MFKISALISITYIYFLLYAQFAFLELVKNTNTEILKSVMTAMGASGLLFSFITAYLLNKNLSTLNGLKIGFLGCGISALLSTYSHDPIYFITCASLIGIFLAILTVSLASCLIQYLTLDKAGICSAIGTGVAYFICNIPFLFATTPSNQAIFSFLVCITGYLITLLPQEIIQNNKHKETGYIFQKKFYWLSVLCLLTLVWFDSAAFYIIQSAKELKSVSWGNDFQMWRNGIIHLMAALLSGLLIKNNKFFLVFILAFLSLVCGVFFVQISNDLSFLSAPFYCAGVSLYSTTLVALPTLTSSTENKINIFWRAGLLYGIAGWFGSAMGIGMVQDLNRIPITFEVISGFVILTSYLYYQRSTKAIISVILVFLIPNRYCHSQDIDETNINKGRKVYIREGCINCHSQFIRPIKEEIIAWGPYKDYNKILEEEPPLIGNRRQGPDLLNIGLRRSSEWLKAHFIDPSLISPNSRMPSYSHLFKTSDGTDLISYLNSQGKDQIEERFKLIREWKPDNSLSELNASKGEELFNANCSQCHGVSANILHNLATDKYFLIKPRNLKVEKYRYIEENSNSFLFDLARIIKFGIYGTSMPGHELLSDQDILNISAYVKSLKKS